MADDLIDAKPVIDSFPGGYRKVTEKMTRTLPIVWFNFTLPDTTERMPFEGLAYVNG
ncbi:MAG TPA: hypothetical protein VJ890_10405 [Vineibacter sp.]|nr:hypothetical protein [Vineibacter sp.]